MTRNMCAVYIGDMSVRMFVILWNVLHNCASLFLGTLPWQVEAILLLLLLFLKTSKNFNKSKLFQA